MLFPIGMATVTGATLVNITGHALMFIIHIILIMFMTENTLEYRKIIRLHMAIGADIPFSLVTAGINREIVIPGRIVPVGSAVTGLALRRESGRQVIGIGGGVIIILVTGKALNRGAGIAVGMAIQAVQRHVRPGQRETGVVMIEDRRRPAGGAVAFGAILAKVVGHVIGVLHRHIIILMAGITFHRRIGITLLVTLNAVQRHVRSGQWEPGVVVIEQHIIPIAGVVALQTLVAEVVGHVIGVLHRVEIILMAGEAGGRRIGIALVVAFDAVQRHVRSGQREPGVVVIEQHVVPIAGVVAIQTLVDRKSVV